MSHFNFIAQTNPERIFEDNQKKIASRILALNNNIVRHTFDSGDYNMELDLNRKETEAEILTQRLVNPPMIKRKFPLLRQGPTSGKKTFDSADYFLEVYKKTPVN